MAEVVGADAVVAGNSLGGFTALAAASYAPSSIKVSARVPFAALMVVFGRGRDGIIVVYV